MVEMQHVEGQDKGKLVLFALSTCGWCKKTRALIEDLDADYEYVYVDLLKGEEREEIVESGCHNARPRPAPAIRW